MYCIKCGNENDENAVFCRKCGYNLTLDDNVRENNRRNEIKNEKNKMSNANKFGKLSFVFAILTLISIPVIFINNYLILISFVFSIASLVLGFIALFVYNSSRTIYLTSLVPILLVIIFFLITFLPNELNNQKFNTDYVCKDEGRVVDLEIDKNENKFEFKDETDIDYVIGKIEAINELKNKNTYEIIVNSINESKIYNVKFNKDNIILTDTNLNKKYTCIKD